MKYNSVNTLIDDKDSEITSFGKHNRLLVSQDTEYREWISIREDNIGLPYSTEFDRRKIANSWQRMPPKGKRLFYICSETYFSNGMERIQHDYLYY